MRLREFRPDDLELSLRVVSDDRVTRFLSFDSLSREQQTERLTAAMERAIGDQNCEVRLHDATLYASVFRYDDEVLINPHIWGRPASANPVIHVRRTNDDSMFMKYLDGFDQVWRQAAMWNPDEARSTW